MKRLHIMLCTFGVLLASNAGAWTATVTGVLHHYNYLAVYLSPDPGPGTCLFGSPYLVVVDDTIASKERVALLMTALTTGQTIGGYADGCDSGIWAQSRPLILRLLVLNN